MPTLHDRKRLESITTLTFDIFDTVLNLADSLVPPLNNFLDSCGVTHATGQHLWQYWKRRQRIEQYQDTLLLLQHKGYLDTNHRALMYMKIPFKPGQLNDLMESYKSLIPFRDTIDGPTKSGNKFDLLMLSNGELWHLKHLANNQIKVRFDEIISV